MCSHPTGEVWAERSSGTISPCERRCAKGVGHIDRVPIDDRRADEVQARRAVLLGLMAAVYYARLSERVDGLR